MKNLWNLNQLIVFEITTNLPLKDKIRLSGVCKELHKKIHFKNAMGEYICLKTPGIEEILIRTINKNEQMKLATLASFLKSITNINFQNSYGDTALMVVYCYDRPEIFKLLLENGADVNIQNNDGKTKLMMTALNGELEIVKLLLETTRRGVGADINIQNNEGDTALMMAVYCFGRPETAKLLLENGADVNIQDNRGNTALILAARRGKTEIIKFLLKYRADTDIQNNYGNTALIMAAIYGRTETLKLLLEAGADINIQDYDRQTALTLAKGQTEIVQMLRRFSRNKVYN